MRIANHICVSFSITESGVDLFVNSYVNPYQDVRRFQRKRNRYSFVRFLLTTNVVFRLELIKEAVQEDENGNYEKAIAKYTNGLEYFQRHMKYDKNEQSRQAIKAKVPNAISVLV